MVSPSCTRVDIHPPSTEEKAPVSRLGVFRCASGVSWSGAHGPPTALSPLPASLVASLHFHSAGKAFSFPSPFSFVLVILAQASVALHPVPPGSSSPLSSLHHSPEQPAHPAASAPFPGAYVCFSGEITLTVTSWLSTVLPPQACWHGGCYGASVGDQTLPRQILPLRPCSL